jgi:acyl-CoA reductase-like NAD-dependent aldehyde dehydrogenase
MIDLSSDISRLVAGAESWAGQPAAARSRLALETALTTAAAADAWTEVAVAIKQAAGTSAEALARAEETATGPLVTLRLLLVTVRALADIGRGGLPRLPRPPRLAHRGSDAARIEVEAIPAAGPRGTLHDSAIFSGHRATIRCVDPGGLEAFTRSWREEVARRPRAGGVALVVGAGNVTGLAPGDCISQIFEHGRSAVLKLHPLHAPLAPVLADALAPLIRDGLLAIHVGGPEVVQAAIAAPPIGHVHLTGGAAAFEAIVWGGGDRRGPPRLVQPITCELGNVTPWFIVPGRYSPRALARQADTVAASIVNNTSFNCIATKLVVTARSWEQREAFLGLIQQRLAAMPPRAAWYPGSASAWATLSGRALPADGTLPWVVRAGIDPDGDSQFIEREWFVPVAAEVPLNAGSIEAFCTAAHELVARLPGSLAASVTLPDSLPAHDRARVELLVEHLPFGVVAVNTWSAIAYTLGSVPWGGFPGGTLQQPRSGIGFVHDPLLLPLVHNTILRAPLVSRLLPAWFPWHRNGLTLARGVLDMYAGLARGKRGLWPLARMLPAVLSG